MKLMKGHQNVMLSPNINYVWSWNSWKWNKWNSTNSLLCRLHYLIKGCFMWMKSWSTYNETFCEVLKSWDDLKTRTLTNDVLNISLLEFTEENFSNISLLSLSQILPSISTEQTIAWSSEKLGCKNTMQTPPENGVFLCKWPPIHLQMAAIHSIQFTLSCRSAVHGTLHVGFVKPEFINNVLFQLSFETKFHMVSARLTWTNYTPVSEIAKNDYIIAPDLHIVQ